MAALGGEGVYGASKSAVLAISESLRCELEPEGIGVSVLCPAYVNSKILGAQRNRSASFGERAPDPMGTDEVTTGLPASSVGDAAVAAIRENRAYVFTYPESMTKRIRPGAEERFRAILEAITARREVKFWNASELLGWYRTETGQGGEEVGPVGLVMKTEKLLGGLSSAVIRRYP